MCIQLHQPVWSATSTCVLALAAQQQTLCRHAPGATVALSLTLSLTSASLEVTDYRDDAAGICGQARPGDRVLWWLRAQAGFAAALLLGHTGFCEQHLTQSGY
jgi:hypothetical protein